ncbi:MAG: MoxR family ATPase [Lachnospiraceae bacterium]|nr:MoxR family ATPase [Lachnospiraceae bacterium]MDO4966928.1 MoxR family ATPase [Lachnospiraceae bacterium]
MISDLKTQIRKYFVGKEELVENLLICFFAGGHVLLEDVPGVGKTTLASTLAHSVDCDFGRIQFTPDTLPTDVMGTEIYNMKTGEFEYRKGSIMHQVVLADEINRTSPKVQSALLEAMSEGQTTVGGKKYDLPKPFMVIATQNPVEFMGTYPLPEAQMDRFMMKLSIGYPGENEELRMVSNMLSGTDIGTIESIVSSKDIIDIQEKVTKVTVKPEIQKYAYEIVEGTRNNENFVLGASPRALLALIKASQAKAFIDGRDFVKPDDVKSLAYVVLGHRLVLTSEAKFAKADVKKLLDAIVVAVKVPH